MSRAASRLSVDLRFAKRRMAELSEFDPNCVRVDDLLN